MCTNPDCRISTVGPSTVPSKSVVIGEAAHIFGARPSSKRFRQDMSDKSRSEITNGIWLCCNCHSIVDKDEDKYPATILYAWREVHEKYVAENLGKSGDQIRSAVNDELLREFENYPPIIRRIIIDKPLGWEWQLTSEIMRYLNDPIYERWDDLNSGLYIDEIEHVDKSEIVQWSRNRIRELEEYINPFKGIFEKLNISWGLPGEPGDAIKIKKACELLQRHLIRIVAFEERLAFARLPKHFDDWLSVLRGTHGSQLAEIKTIPEQLDNALSLIGTDHGGSIENPKKIDTVVNFVIPEGWSKKLSKAYDKGIKRTFPKSIEETTSDIFNGCFSIIVLIFIVIFMVNLF